MKLAWITLLLLNSALMLNAASTDVAQLMEDKCSNCHFVSNAYKEMKAPPMWGVKKIVNQHYKTPDEAKAFIIDYVMNPSKEKMAFPEATFKRFGLMPSQQGKLTQEELEAIVEYFYR